MKLSAWQRLPWILLVALLASAAASCRSSTTDPETNVRTVVGPAGGTVLGPEGASVEIPAGALAADQAITIRIASDSEAPPIPGDVTLVTKTFSFEPHGLAFRSPVTVRLPIAAGAVATNVVALRADPGAAWEEREAAVGSDVRVTTSQFSFYCGGRRPTAEVGANDGGTSDDAAPPDAGPRDAGPGDAGACVGRTLDLSSVSTTSLGGLQGAWTTSAPSFSLTNAVSAYAERGFYGQYRIHLTDHANSCEYARAGSSKTGGKEFFISAFDGAIGISPGTYGPTNFYVGTEDRCGAIGGGDGRPPIAGTLTVTVADTTVISGTLNAVLNGETFTASFTAAVCPARPDLTLGCCIP